MAPACGRPGRAYFQTTPPFSVFVFWNKREGEPDLHLYKLSLNTAFVWSGVVPKGKKSGKSPTSTNKGPCIAAQICCKLSHAGGCRSSALHSYTLRSSPQPLVCQKPVINTKFNKEIHSNIILGIAGFIKILLLSDAMFSKFRLRPERLFPGGSLTIIHKPLVEKKAGKSWKTRGKSWKIRKKSWKITLSHGNEREYLCLWEHPRAFYHSLAAGSIKVGPGAGKAVMKPPITPKGRRQFFPPG